MSYDDARENSPSGLRMVADELKASSENMLGKGTRLNGNINQIDTGQELSPAQMGRWSDALSLTAAVGSRNAGVKLQEVYDLFIKGYQDIVAAVEASAANHDRARKANEGDV